MYLVSHLVIGIFRWCDAVCNAIAFESQLQTQNNESRLRYLCYCFCLFVRGSCWIVHWMRWIPSSYGIVMQSSFELMAFCITSRRHKERRRHRRKKNVERTSFLIYHCYLLWTSHHIRPFFFLHWRCCGLFSFILSYYFFFVFVALRPNWALSLTLLHFRALLERILFRYFVTLYITLICSFNANNAMKNKRKQMT